MLAKLAMLKEQVTLRTLQSRLMTILPEEYQDRYEDIEPVSMGSAALKYGADGKVAWGEIWNTFCDLAMAGGPPHKGMLLEPGTTADIEKHPAEHRAVVDEIIRGIRLASEIAVTGPSRPGWVRLDCGDRAMAEWLMKAIVMENISCRWEDTTIDVPAGPNYRIGKEVKNVITSVAKTTHYWMGHMWRTQKEEIRKTFAQMAKESPVVQPALIGVDCTPAAHDALYNTMSAAIPLPLSARRYTGWLGVECPTVRAAVWMMRLLAAMNVVARREHTELFVPVNPATDPQGQLVTNALARVHRFAVTQDVWPAT
jgi:hypothetical protein